MANFADMNLELEEEERRHRLEVLCSKDVLSIMAGKKSVGEGGEQISLNRKSAIRFALRKYFCDQILRDGEGWIRVGLNTLEWEVINNSRHVARDEAYFARYDG